jgi:hypothetical protein
LDRTYKVCLTGKMRTPRATIVTKNRNGTEESWQVLSKSLQPQLICLQKYSKKSKKFVQNVKRCLKKHAEDWEPNRKQMEDEEEARSKLIEDKETRRKLIEDIEASCRKGHGVICDYHAEDEFNYEDYDNNNDHEQGSKEDNKSEEDSQRGKTSVPHVLSGSIVLSPVCTVRPISTVYWTCTLQKRLLSRYASLQSSNHCNNN